MKRVYYFIRWVGIFFYELTKANIEVVKLVLSPTLRIKPGFLTVPMKASTDFEVTSLANSITLTPGTISVHVPDDRHAVVIHALDIGDDPEAVRRSIQDNLEANILKWTRPLPPADRTHGAGGASQTSDESQPRSAEPNDMKGDDQ